MYVNGFLIKLWQKENHIVRKLYSVSCGDQDGKEIQKEGIYIHIKKQRHHFADKGPSSQSYGFSSNCVRMWELDHKEGWALKNWCFHTVVLEKTLESPLDCKEIKPVNPKGINPEYSLDGLKLKLPYFGHLMQRTDSLEKTLLLGKTEGRKRRRRHRMRWLDHITNSMDINTCLQIKFASLKHWSRSCPLY